MKEVEEAALLLKQADQPVAVVVGAGADEGGNFMAVSSLCKLVALADGNAVTVQRLGDVDSGVLKELAAPASVSHLFFTADDTALVVVAGGSVLVFSAESLQDPATKDVQPLASVVAFDKEYVTHAALSAYRLVVLSDSTKAVRLVTWKAANDALSVQTVMFDYTIVSVCAFGADGFVAGTQTGWLLKLDRDAKITKRVQVHKDWPVHGVASTDTGVVVAAVGRAPDDVNVAVVDMDNLANDAVDEESIAEKPFVKAVDQRFYIYAVGVPSWTDAIGDVVIVGTSIAAETRVFGRKPGSKHWELRLMPETGAAQAPLDQDTYDDTAFVGMSAAVINEELRLLLLTTNGHICDYKVSAAESHQAPPKQAVQRKQLPTAAASSEGKAAFPANGTKRGGNTFTASSPLGDTGTTSTPAAPAVAPATATTPAAIDTKPAVTAPAAFGGMSFGGFGGVGTTPASTASPFAPKTPPSSTDTKPAAAAASPFGGMAFGGFGGASTASAASPFAAAVKSTSTASSASPFAPAIKPSSEASPFANATKATSATESPFAPAAKTASLSSPSDGKPAANTPFGSMAFGGFGGANTTPAASPFAPAVKASSAGGAPAPFGGMAFGGFGGSSTASSGSPFAPAVKSTSTTSTDSPFAPAVKTSTKAADGAAASPITFSFTAAAAALAAKDTAPPTKDTSIAVDTAPSTPATKPGNTTSTESSFAPSGKPASTTQNEPSHAPAAKTATASGDAKPGATAPMFGGTALGGFGTLNNTAISPSPFSPPASAAPATAAVAAAPPTSVAKPAGNASAVSPFSLPASTAPAALPFSMPASTAPAASPFSMPASTAPALAASIAAPAASATKPTNTAAASPFSMPANTAPVASASSKPASTAAAASPFSKPASAAPAASPFSLPASTAPTTLTSAPAAKAAANTTFDASAFAQASSTKAPAVPAVTASPPKIVTSPAATPVTPSSGSKLPSTPSSDANKDKQPSSSPSSATSALMAVLTTSKEQLMGPIQSEIAQTQHQLDALLGPGRRTTESLQARMTPQIEAVRTKLTDTRKQETPAAVLLDQVKTLHLESAALVDEANVTMTILSNPGVSRAKLERELDPESARLQRDIRVKYKEVSNALKVLEDRIAVLGETASTRSPQTPKRKPITSTTVVDRVQRTHEEVIAAHDRIKHLDAKVSAQATLGDLLARLSVSSAPPMLTDYVTMESGSARRAIKGPGAQSNRIPIRQATPTTNKIATTPQRPLPPQTQPTRAGAASTADKPPSLAATVSAQSSQPPAAFTSPSPALTFKPAEVSTAAAATFAGFDAKRDKPVSSTMPAVPLSFKPPQEVFNVAPTAPVLAPMAASSFTFPLPSQKLPAAPTAVAAPAAGEPKAAPSLGFSFKPAEPSASMPTAAALQPKAENAVAAPAPASLAFAFKPAAEPVSTTTTTLSKDGKQAAAPAPSLAFSFTPDKLNAAPAQSLSFSIKPPGEDPNVPATAPFLSSAITKPAFAAVPSLPFSFKPPEVPTTSKTSPSSETKANPALSFSFKPTEPSTAAATSTAPAQPVNKPTLSFSFKAPDTPTAASAASQAAALSSEPKSGKPAAAAAAAPSLSFSFKPPELTPAAAASTSQPKTDKPGFAAVPSLPFSFKPPELPIASATSAATTPPAFTFSFKPAASTAAATTTTAAAKSDRPAFGAAPLRPVTFKPSKHHKASPIAGGQTTKSTFSLNRPASDDDEEWEEDDGEGDEGDEEDYDDEEDFDDDGEQAEEEENDEDQAASDQEGDQANAKGEEDDDQDEQGDDQDEQGDDEGKQKDEEDDQVGQQPTKSQPAKPEQDRSEPSQSKSATRQKLADPLTNTKETGNPAAVVGAKPLSAPGFGGFSAPFSFSQPPAAEVKPPPTTPGFGGFTMPTTFGQPALPSFGSTNPTSIGTPGFSIPVAPQTSSQSPAKLDDQHKPADVKKPTPEPAQPEATREAEPTKSEATAQAEPAEVTPEAEPAEAEPAKTEPKEPEAIQAAQPTPPDTSYNVEAARPEPTPVAFSQQQQPQQQLQQPSAPPVIDAKAVVTPAAAEHKPQESAFGLGQLNASLSFGQPAMPSFGTPKAAESTGLIAVPAPPAKPATTTPPRNMVVMGSDDDLSDHDVDMDDAVEPQPSSTTQMSSMPTGNLLQPGVFGTGSIGMGWGSSAAPSSGFAPSPQPHSSSSFASQRPQAQGFGTFGAPSPPTFGQSGFGGNAAFGSTSALGFGAPRPTMAAASSPGFGSMSGSAGGGRVFGAGTAVQAGSGFGALAQQAGGFGALAQQAPGGFGSAGGFGGMGQQAPTGFGAVAQQAPMGFGAVAQQAPSGFGAVAQQAPSSFGALAQQGNAANNGFQPPASDAFRAFR